MKFLNNLDLTKLIKIDFTTNTNEIHSLYWDDENRTLSAEMGNGVIQQIGQEQYILVRNNTESTILSGTIVQMVGVVGESGRMLVEPAINDSIDTLSILGVLTEDIPTLGDGLVTTFGLVRELDTSNWLNGDRLYLDPNNPGSLTKVKPNAPHSSASIAVALHIDSSEGSIFVRPTLIDSLRDLSDVNFESLSTNDLIQLNSSGIWENIHLTDFRLAANQIDLEDDGNYFTIDNVESALQETGKFLYNLMSTGVVDFTGITKVDDTHFSVGAAKGYIVDNTTDIDQPTVQYVEFAGQSNIQATNIGISSQTQIFINADGILEFSATDQPMCPERRDKIFLGRVVHPSTIITAVENLPDFIQSPNAQLRDLWKGLGMINDHNYVYSNNTPSTNLSLALHGGTLYYNGIGFTTNKKRPTRVNIASQTLLNFNYRLRTGAGTNGVTVLDPTKYDNNGVLTNMPTAPGNASNQRIYLNSTGLILIQYGQQVYSTLADAIAGLVTETFVRAPAIEYNATLIGVISVTRGATTLGNGYARFHGVSKFGELGGGGAGAGASVAAQDVAISDAGSYYTGTNVELALQEIGYDLANIVTDTSSVVAGNGVDISSEQIGSNTEYTISHEDTSTLSGVYGTEGISSITVDGFGHLTSVTTNSYLTSSTQSQDFGKAIVTDTDSGYTWADTGTATADQNQDTLTFVSGTGINLQIDSSADAIKVINTGVTSVDGNSGTVTATQLLNAIKTVDGSGSGLDADTLDGLSSAAFAPVSHGNHVLYGTDTTTITPDSAKNDGVAAEVSRTDHTHKIDTDSAVGLSNTSLSTEGVSTAFARADHTHEITGFDNYQYWTISDSVNSDLVYSHDALQFVGLNQTTVEYIPNQNKLTIDTSIGFDDLNQKPSPTITLEGDVTGSVTLTNLSSGTITTTIAANSVALGSDTTGNYIASAAEGSGIDISISQAEGGTLTISHEDTSSVANITSNNSDGVVIQDVSLSFDGFGHTIVASVGTVNLDTRYYTESEVDSKLSLYQLESEKGQANGYASLDASGLVPSNQLPSYVDDVLEYINLAAFPTTGETGKIYVALNTNKTYRWSGSAYVYITSGAVDSVAGKTGVVTLVKGDVGLTNVDNTADANKSVASAAKLTTSRNINGVAFDGTQNITVYDATKQPLDADLTAIAGLVGTTGLLRKTAADTWTLDTSAVGGTVTQVSTSGSITGGPITSSGTITHLTTSGHKHIPSGGSTGQALLWDSDGTAAWGTVSTENTKYNLDGSGSTNSAVLELIGTDSTTDSITFVGGSGLSTSWSESEQKITTDLVTAYGDTKNPYGSKSANYILAAPNGSAGTPSFRAIVAADIPTLNQNTTGTAANVTGAVAITNGGTGATTAAGALTNLGLTATAAELNILDGATLTTTELNYVDGVTSSIQTQLNAKAASSHTHAISDVTNLQTSLDSKSPLASPTFTGTPAAPTAAAGTATTQIATTAFVTAEITNDRPWEATATNIKMNGTQAVGVLSTVARADHVHPTDTSRAAASHTHGNITNAGAIGSTSGLAVVTTTSGVLTTGMVAIASGGTGATTAAAALTNLGLTATNTEINILDIVAGSSGKYLKSNGTTATWEVVAAEVLPIQLYTNSVSSDFLIPTGNNAISVGPLTILDTATVTISDGSRWVVY